MSELTDARAATYFRRHLLATVSAFALIGPIGHAKAESEDEGRPTVWIELGGQAERTVSSRETLEPPFLGQVSTDDLKSLTQGQTPPKFSIGGEAKITFSPKDSNWLISAEIRYGRANSAKHLHDEGPKLPEELLTLRGNPFLYYSPQLREFADGQSTSGSTHTIVDFKVGKDVGLGLFGINGGSSVISAGVRFAQFTSRINSSLHARPNIQVETVGAPIRRFYELYAHTYTAGFQAERKTDGIGPSLSWEASVPVAGSDNGMGVSVDWGVNAAILFGRQRARTHHQTTGSYNYHLASYTYLLSHYAHGPYDSDRSRTIVVPNVGGMAGLSFRFPNAKFDVGYRADFFFGAMDNGIDSGRRDTIGFYGPFATISIGLGG